MSIRVDAKGKVFTDIVRKDEVPALIQTVTNLIHGHIFLRPEQRIKDEFNEGKESFIAVTKARVYGADGKVLYHSDFLTLNKTYIVWIKPDEETDEPEQGQP